MIQPTLLTATSLSAEPTKSVNSPLLLSAAPKSADIYFGHNDADTTQSNEASRRQPVTWKSALSSVASLVIPGVGQYINDSDQKNKVLTHFVMGFVFPPIRVWSAYDALFNRKGGYKGIF